MWSSCLVFLFIVGIKAEICGNKAYSIRARGIDNQAIKDIIVNEHNRCRTLIAKGKVPRQPRGVNLKRMSYDEDLAKGAKIVSDTCEMEHIIKNDRRWFAVGQNIYRERSSLYSSYQNWTRAVNWWFREHRSYDFPDDPVYETAHYTQVVWADSIKVGCDFIQFYDYDIPQYPWTSMYTCNYGPAGNILGKPPYKSGISGCENLC